MNITNLTLKNFRNYNDEVFEFDNGINILTGQNAQGKTNAAEAIFFLCTGYSPRANKDKFIIKSGCETAEIFGSASSNYGDISVKIEFNKNDKKNIYVGGVQVLRVGELLGNINSVFFNPQELKLVQESPEDRRRFLNISLSQKSKAYFYALQRYNKILAQRNVLLKDNNKSLIRETLFLWDEQLCKEAAKIIYDRNEFLKELAPIASEKHAYLSGGKETLTMHTESEYTGLVDEIKENLKQDLKECLEKDMTLGYTTIGPHRDDIKFLLNNYDVKIFGSQGQQRTVALSLKLAETETFKNKFNEYPVLILDDVLSELDSKRKKNLIRAVDGIQTIFTCTHVDRTLFKGYNYKKFTIENGKIKR